MKSPRKLQKILILFCLAAIPLSTVLPIHAAQDEIPNRERKKDSKQANGTMVIIGTFLSIAVIGVLYNYNKSRKKGVSQNVNEDNNEVLVSNKDEMKGDIKEKSNEDNNQSNQDSVSKEDQIKEVVVTDQSNGVFLIDLKNNREKRFFDNNNNNNILSYLSAALSPDGTILAAVFVVPKIYSRKVVLFDVTTGKRIGNKYYGEDILAFAWNQDQDRKGEEFIVVDKGGTINLFTEKNKWEEKTIEIKNSSFDEDINELSFPPNRSLITYSLEINKKFVILDKNKNSHAYEAIIKQSSFDKIRLSPDRKALATCNSSNMESIEIFEIGKGTESVSYKIDGRLLDMQWSNNSKYLAVSRLVSDVLYSIDILHWNQKGKTLESKFSYKEKQKGINDFTWSKDDEKLLICTDTDTDIVEYAFKEKKIVRYTCNDNYTHTYCHIDSAYVADIPSWDKVQIKKTEEIQKVEEIETTSSNNSIFSLLHL